EEVMALGPPAGARHEIDFNIEPAGRHVIVVATPLPEITQAVHLRGQSQPRPPGESPEEEVLPAIEIRGAFPDFFVTPLGLKITSGGAGSIVENLAITNIRNSIVGFQAILLENTQDVTIVANY